MTITFYTKPDHVQYDATCRALDRKDIDYRLVVLLDDEKVLHHVRSLGYQQFPVVQTTSEHWSGLRTDKTNLFSASTISA